MPNSPGLTILRRYCRSEQDDSEEVEVEHCDLTSAVSGPLHYDEDGESAEAEEKGDNDRRDGPGPFPGPDGQSLGRAASRTSALDQSEDHAPEADRRQDGATTIDTSASRRISGFIDQQE